MRKAETNHDPPKLIWIYNGPSGQPHQLYLQHAEDGRETARSICFVRDKGS